MAGLVDTRTEFCSRVRDALLQHRNADGGWGYYAGKASRVEPTCWALLSLFEERRTEDTTVVLDGLRLLGRWQRDDGLISEPRLPANLAFNGLASLLVTAIRSSALSAGIPDGLDHRLLRSILGTRSRTGWNLRLIVRQDDSLVGWPWMRDTFAWVEPTAWCLLALKKGALGRDEEVVYRVTQAEDLLFDRQCETGGWNAGNAESLGKPLNAYVPTTALVLISLADRLNSSAVKRAQDYLIDSWRAEPAGMALALTLLAFRASHLPTVDVENTLAETWRRTGFLGNFAVFGLARYATMAGAHGPNAFTI